MSLQCYTKMMKALWSEKFLTADEMCGKDVLLVGLSCFGSALVSVLQQPFFAAGAKVDYAPLFNEYIGVSSSLAQLEENVGGKKYDIVVLLEGLEKETHFVRSAEALAACCRLGGKLLLLVQTPDAADEALDVERFLEASWAYDLQDIASLFPGFALLSHVRTSPSFLLAARLEKRSEERPLRPTAYSLRLKQHVSERKGLQAGFFREFHELERLGVEELTDKCRYRHNYLQKYEFFLRDWKEKPLRLLELGVFKGGSERMWKRYFPQAEIYGVDIDESCRAHAEERIEIRIGDLSKEEVLESLKEIRPHIIVDDASHIWSHQIKALFALFPSLPSGGVYILEDLETSFQSRLFPDHGDAPIDAYTVAERIARVAASRIPCTDGSFAEEITAAGMATELVATMLSSCIFIKR